MIATLPNEPLFFCDSTIDVFEPQLSGLYVVLTELLKTKRQIIAVECKARMLSDLELK